MSKDIAVTEACPNCGVPELIHSKTCCGWQNAGTIILPGETTIPAVLSEEKKKERWEDYEKLVSPSPSGEEAATPTAKEVIMGYELFDYTGDELDETHIYLDNAIEAMEEYAAMKVSPLLSRIEELQKQSGHGQAIMDLSRFILENCPGYPNTNTGAIETSMQIIRELQHTIKKLQEEKKEQEIELSNKTGRIKYLESAFKASENWNSRLQRDNEEMEDRIEKICTERDTLKKENEELNELLERAKTLVGHPATNASLSVDIACENWHKDIAALSSKQSNNQKQG